MSNKVISWQALGSPAEPGTYTVKGIGEVAVEQEDIDDVKGMGTNPRVEILETTIWCDKTETYIIRRLIP